MIKFSEFLQEEYQRIANTQYGSNPGGLHIHKETGEKHYIKFPKNEEQARVEVAAANLYKHAGIKTTEPKLVSVGGKLGVASKWLDNHKTIGYDYHKHIQTDQHALDLANLYHASVILNNRDSIGLEYDNVLRSPEGHLVSVDQGGSMHFRAMGEDKEFDHDKIPEKDSILNNKYSSGQVYNHVFNNFPEVKQRSLDKIRHSFTDENIDKSIEEAGLHKDFATAIKKRRDLLLKE